VAKNSRQVAFKKVQLIPAYRLKFPFRRLRRDAEALPRWEAATTGKTAKRSMRKGPKKPKSRFGQLKAYRSGKKYGKFYWQKGLYSRPGHPPFHYGKPFDLRRIEYAPIALSAAKRIRRTDFRHTLGAGIKHGYRVGPVYKSSFHSTPVPQLHEFGGSVKIRKQASVFQTRNPNIRLRRTGWIGPGGTTGVTGGTGSLHYPPRPYMRPAGHKTRTGGRKGGSLRWLYKLGGMRGYRI
jgi:hypothetical protein